MDAPPLNIPAIRTPGSPDATAADAEALEQGRFDVYTRLLKDRIVFLGTDVNDDVANFIIAQMLFLEAQDPDRPIWMYINSPGGVITSGLAILDTMNLIAPDVSTICVGLAASMGTVLLCAGAKGKRYTLANSTIHMHQPLGGAQGQATDIEIAAREILRAQDKIRKLFHFSNELISSANCDCLWRSLSSSRWILLSAAFGT